MKHTPALRATPLDRGDAKQLCLKSPLERGARQGGGCRQRPQTNQISGQATALQFSNRGFALVITLSLLALLVLAVVALSALTRVNSRIATISLQQTRARQHALLGFNVALGELQKYAGTDSQVTAMAGVTGVAALSANTTRHWCGIWTASGDFVVWLASGAVTVPNARIQNNLTGIALVGAGSVGGAAANSEHVEAGKLAISVVDPLTGQTRSEGNYAWWIGDEGTKISAYSPPEELVLAGISPVLGSNPATSATAKLRTALAAYPAKLPQAISYEQLSLLPTPALAALTPSVLQDSFHHTTLTAYRLIPQSPDVLRRAGVFNINTNSAIAWRGILETYNTTSPGPPLAAVSMGTSSITSLPSRIANNLAAAIATGKAANGPFTTVDSFANSALLSSALTASGSGVTPAQLIAGIGPLLTTRSDTFRIRGYGDTLDAVDQTTVQAAATCEAIVQRISEPAPNGLGRRFVIVYFRWLGPDDI
jgi:hypothetical protein